MRMVNPVTTNQAAEILGVHRSRVTRMVHIGRLAPTAKLPGTTGAYLFDRDDVEALAAARAAGAVRPRPGSGGGHGRAVAARTEEA